jgi:hypothetical protein
MESPRTPGNDDKLKVDDAAAIKRRNNDISRFGLLAPLVRAYYRYTVMTGVYMLGTVETCLLHLAFLLGFFFTYTYFSSVAWELGCFFFNSCTVWFPRAAANLSAK